jgi:hypothetical protein
MQNQLRAMGFGGAVVQAAPAPAGEARPGSSVSRGAPASPADSGLCLGSDCATPGARSEVSLHLAEPVMPAALPELIRMQLPNIARLSVGKISFGVSSDLFGPISAGSLDQIFDGITQFNTGWPTTNTGRSRGLLGGANIYDTGDREERQSAVDRVFDEEGNRRGDGADSDRQHRDAWRAEFDRASAQLGGSEYIFASGGSSEATFARAVLRLIDPRNYSAGELFLLAIPLLLVLGFVSMLSSSRR